MGKLYQVRGQWNQALTLYRGAESINEAGAICQLMYALPEQLSATNLGYCKSVFSSGDLYLADDRRYQRFSMTPGTKFRFSARIRVNDIAGKVRPLYVGWSDGEPQGSAAPDFESPTAGWVYVEREYVFPTDAIPYLSFYPVHIVGEGDVEVKDVWLEIVP